MKLMVMKKGIAFLPAYKTDLQKLSKLKDGNAYTFTLSEHRNLKHHRKFFAILRMAVFNGIFEKMGYEPTECTEKGLNETLLLILKYMHLPKRKIVIPGRIEITEAASINFEKMDQATFEEFYENCIGTISMFLGITRDEINKNWTEYA